MLHESESEVDSIISSDVGELPQNLKRTRKKNVNKTDRRFVRPQVVIPSDPEKQHFTNNYKQELEKSKRKREQNKPLVMLIGDSTIKQISSCQIKQKCKCTNIMVRSLQGGRIKNIKNLVINMLEDVKPEAICIHVSTNDINDGRSVGDITHDMEILINLIQRQGIVPIISLVTQRSDKHASKVDVVNKRLIRLCNHHGVGYIEHPNITKST